MPILETFCNALRSAITEYETENNDIPPYRRDEIATLRTRLDARQRDQVDPIRLRDEILDYLEQLSVGFLAFIPFFDSRLRKKLKEVINRTDFSEKELGIADRTEIRTANQAIANTLNTLATQFADLSRLLAEERAKDNVRLVNSLQQELSKKNDDIDFLTQKNIQLQQALDATDEELQAAKADCVRLFQEKEEWREKYEALLQAQASRNEEHAQVPPGNF